VIADGRIALGDGDANDHATTGQFTIWRLPAAARLWFARSVHSSEALSK
jgi:hypothetical protein